MDLRFATAKELVASLGERLRDLRVGQGLQQGDLAARAGVSVRTIRDLELGHGGTLTSLMRVVKGLGATEWVEALAPKAGVDPMALLEGQAKPRLRVRRRQQEGR